MRYTTTEPIEHNWTPRANPNKLAYATTRELAQYQVADLDDDLRPLLNAAADELAGALGLPPQFRPDREQVVAVRIIAKAAIINPSAGGGATQALLDELVRRRSR